jgi:hypothetical protein
LCRGSFEQWTSIYPISLVIWYSQSSISGALM